MTRPVRALSLAALLAAALLTAGCTTPAADPTAAPTATTTPAASGTPTEAPTQEPAPVSIPSDCDDLGTAASRDETVGDMTLQSDGTGFVRPAPEGATLELGCDWIVGEASGLLVLISTASPDAVTAAVADLSEQGYTCAVADDFGAEFCSLEGQGTDTEEDIVARDGVWIYLSSVNRNARAFLSDIAAQIFG
ncbi:hypothetical protein [Microbacterium sp. GXF7504]